MTGMTNNAMPERDFDVALVLSGGNALGAYQAGAYQALIEGDVRVDWVVGASTGAINGVIICGNAPDVALARLREYWRVPGGDTTPGMWGGVGEDARRTLAACRTLLTGQPQVFLPRHLLGPWWEPFGNREPSSLYDSKPLDLTLGALADFDRVNSGDLRFSVAAVDLEQGRDVVFDTRRDTITAEHVRASGALIPALPPVRIDGMLLADAGASANLPVDIVLSEPPPRPTLCLTVDLLPLRAPPPRTLGDAAERMQDLMFASQGRRAIEGWKRFYDLRASHPTPDGAGQPSVTLVHLAYGAQAPEVCGKAFDFSPASAAYRWEQGRRGMTRVLERLRAGEIGIGAPGLTVHDMDEQEAV